MAGNNGNVISDDGSITTPTGVRASMGNEQDVDWNPAAEAQALLEGKLPGVDTVQDIGYFVNSANRDFDANPLRVDNGDGATTDTPRQVSRPRMDGETFETDLPPASDIPAPPATVADAPDQSGDLHAASPSASAAGALQDHDVATDATANDLSEDTGEAPAPGDTAPSDRFVYQEGNDLYAVDSAHVRQALGVLDWATKLSEPVRNAMVAIESGQAYAISRADWDEFSAWKGAAAKQTRDADLNQLVSSGGIEESHANYIRQQRDEIEQLRAAQGLSPAWSAGQQQPPIVQYNEQPYMPQPVAPQFAQPVGQVTPEQLQQQGIIPPDAVVARMDEFGRQWAIDNGLSEPEYAAMYTAVAQGAVLEPIARSLAIYNPLNGQMIKPPDYGVVMQKALNYALVNDPALFNQVTARRTAGLTPQQAMAPASAALLAKKARAGALSSAPSSTATPAVQRTGPKSPAQRVQEMAKLIAADW